MAVRNKQAKAIIISPLAKADIIEILNYLSQTWGEKVADEIEHFLLPGVDQPASFWILQQTKEYPKISSEHNLLWKQNKRNPDNNGF
jgi:hypothetical protein